MVACHCLPACLCLACKPSHGCDTTNCHLGGARRVPLRHFFKSYRSVDLHSNEVVVSIEIPLTEQSDHIEAFKVSRRKDDDLAVVCACFGLKLVSTADGHKAIASACLSFGGVAATTTLAHETAAFLENKPLTRETLDGALAVLAHEIKIQYSAPGGLPEYRRSLVSRFVLRLHLSTWCPCGRSGIEFNLTSWSHLTTDSSRGRLLVVCSSSISWVCWAVWTRLLCTTASVVCLQAWLMVCRVAHRRLSSRLYRTLPRQTGLASQCGISLRCSRCVFVWCWSLCGLVGPCADCLGLRVWR